MGELVVADGNAPELLDAAEEPLDQVAVLVPELINSSLVDAMTARRDDCFDLLIGPVFENGLSIVGLVCTERVWR